MKISRRTLLCGTTGALALGTGAYKLLRGFDDDPNEDLNQTIPEGLRREALDVHVHILGTGAAGSGCWMSQPMRDSANTRVGLWNLRLQIDQRDLDEQYVAYLRSRVRGAGFLKQVVALAQDYCYTGAGQRDPSRTPFYTPNSYVAGLALRHTELLFGASIHPYRPDALEELDRVAQLGAVLVKWIPNVQAIDLADARCRAFYSKLVTHQMPLLVHAGDEKALFIAGQEFGDPRRLVTPLEAGVTVIAAHAASLGERDGRSNFDVLAEMLPKWPNLYADTSALTLVTRWRMLLRLAQRTDLHARLVHGSDFPLPPAASLFLGRIPARRWVKAWRHENPLRRDFEVKQALGIGREVYVRGYEVLAPRLRVRQVAVADLNADCAIPTRW